MKQALLRELLVRRYKRELLRYRPMRRAGWWVYVRAYHQQIEAILVRVDYHWKRRLFENVQRPRNLRGWAEENLEAVFVDIFG